MKGATPALQALLVAGITHRVHRYKHDSGKSSYGREAADALAVEPERVYKTLVTMVDGHPVVALVPVLARLDLKMLAAAFGGKSASMATRADAQRATGYVVGAISPMGQKSALPCVLDQSAERWDTIFVSAGRRGLEVELSPEDLRRATGATLAAIANLSE
jgi:Cys-tRNA(Pro)/Cys-tRNA(Cys) deacylase